MNGILLFMVNVTVKSNCSKSHSQLHQIQVKNWPFQDFSPKIPIRKWPISAESSHKVADVHKHESDRVKFFH